VTLLVRAGLELGLARGDHRLLVLELLDVLLVGEHRHLPRKQEVAAEAVLDGDQGPGLAEVVHVFSKNEFHD